MLDDFFIRALIAGIGLAITAGPLGCFVVWRRMAYFGDTMAHSALLGVAFAFVLQISLPVGVFAAAATTALALIGLHRREGLSTDTLLGILAHATLALGLVMIAAADVRVDLLAFLFGDILAVNRADIAVIYGGAVAVLAVVALLWRAMLAATVSHDLAAVEGLRPERARLVFMLLMAAVIAIAMKLIGVLLITSLLIIPAAAARRLSSGPEAMAVLAAVIGVIAVVAGLFGSLTFDTPSGPSIVVAALVLFLIAALPWRRTPAPEPPPHA